MELSSPRFKGFTVSAGFSLWFFVITSAIGIFSLELFVIFIVCALVVTQIFALKLSIGLDIFAVANTKVFLGILFIFVLSMYGIVFKFLRIDLLRLKKQPDTYWLYIEKSKQEQIFKQY
ncbi:MAG: hypothetical protein FJ356_03430 [Thaumarchaeota archaeon]|nr:hypothetical protein [Nitrososphaerota archaeon]